MKSNQFVTLFGREFRLAVILVEILFEKGGATGRFCNGIGSMRRASMQRGSLAMLKSSDWLNSDEIIDTFVQIILNPM